MLKFTHLIGFFLIYLSVNAQKASCYKSPNVNFNTYASFYMLNSPLDAHDITSPFINRKDFKQNESNYFILYNELSLKNLTILDGESEHGTLLFNLYEGNAFSTEGIAPIGYRKKKLKGNNLIIDIMDGGDKTLLFRGWIELRRIKAANDYSRYQKGISLILLNFIIEPVIIE